MSHLENYRREWGFGEQDTVLCEVCGAPADDIHHITFRSHCGGDEFGNLIALCRRDHGRAHSSKLTPEDLRRIKRWPNGRRAEQ